MRLRELHLQAFGLFTDRRLELPEGLVVVSGPNEAGKSTALRALKALLFGFEERSPDAFLHGYDNLRVGGTLALADGRELGFVRKKGHKNTLLDPGTSKPLGDTAIEPFLGTVTASLFSTLFGIDHAAMVSGGQEILEHQGEVGQALFSAAAGTQSLRPLLKELRAEADALFKATGKQHQINVAASQYAATRKRIKDASLAASEWETHRQALEEANRDLVVVQAELGKLRQRHAALLRLKRVRPAVARRRELVAEIADMGRVALLGADFAERHRAARVTLAEATKALDLDRTAAQRQSEELRGLGLREDVLAESEAVSDIFQRLGSYRKALADRPVIEGRVQQARRQAIDLLKGLRPDLDIDAVPSLRPAIMASKLPVQDLLQRSQAVEAAMRNARKGLDNLKGQIAALEADLAGQSEAPDVGPLARAVVDARRAGELDGQMADALATEHDRLAQCQSGLAALGLWQGSLDQAPSLPVPSAETVDRFERRFAELEARTRDLAGQRRAIEDQLSENSRLREELRLGGAVPTEADLEAARDRRQQVWTLVRRAWQEGADVLDQARAIDPGRDLPDAYEALVSQADGVADRLRREADRVAGQARALAAHGQISELLAGVRGEQSTHAASEQALASEWRGAWQPAGIQPLPPREMRGWLGRFGALRDGVAGLGAASRRVAELRGAIARHHAEISARLRALGQTPAATGERLEPLLDQADAVLRAVEDSAAKRRDLGRLRGQRSKAEESSAGAQADLDQWRQEWAQATHCLALAGEARPGTVMGLLEEYARLFEQLDAADNAADRLAHIDRDNRDYEQQVRIFAERVAPELWAGDAAACVAGLDTLASHARKAQGRRETLEKELRAVEQRIAESEADRRHAEAELASLCGEAEVDDAAHLPAAEARAARHEALRKELGNLERQLVEQGDGFSLEELVQQAEAACADDLPGQTEAVTQQIQEIEDRRDALQKQRNVADHELAGMTGTETAAAAAAEGQAILARLRSQVATYLRVRAASALLAREMERYRAANQDPVLLRAGELFAAFTLRSFDTVRSEVGDDDHPRLLGVRPSGKLVSVDGMSSGTRDQLYLALRLATLERYLERAEPMPLVVDDILINFDEERARATLGVLADLARRMQVLLFTHHERVRELATGLATAVAL
ncbi:MAG: AAA family ATPase [Deltaproteobacteria bacterium]|nr:AAA family ATPase [Deltaproteobacteria bacterium]